MAVDFIRPTPLQMLTDTQIQAIEEGKDFDENAARHGINEHFRVNRWAHKDIPLPMVENPITISASEERRAAIRMDDVEAKREVADLKAKAEREQDERESAEAIRNAELRRKDAENDDLRRRIAVLEAEKLGGKPVEPIPAGIVAGEPNPDGSIPSLGRPDPSSTMTEIEEWMAEHSVPLPSGVRSGVSLNTFGKAKLLKYIEDIQANREASPKGA